MNHYKIPETFSYRIRYEISMTAVFYVFCFIKFDNEKWDDIKKLLEQKKEYVLVHREER